MSRLTLTFFLIAAALVAQQNAAMITGRVTDSSGLAVPGAAVAAINQETNLTVHVSSGVDGIYVATPLQIGAYSVEVESKGFKKAVRSDLRLQVQDRLRVDFQLEVGETSQSVEVHGVTPLLETENSSRGQVIETKPIGDLPLNGRNFIQLITLATGAYVPQNNGLLFQNSMVSINGNRIQNNTFLLDGVSNNSTDTSNPPILPSPDAIAEFKVQTSLLTAEFGRSLGGAINVNLKSGTNAFHGSLFEFLRNSQMDANAFFNSGRAKPEFQENQFGFAMGGPLEIPRVYNGKNRTFFFADYQGARVRKGLTRVFSVPTQSLRDGDFTGLGTIYDPASTKPNPAGAGSVRDPFAGNRIPSNRFDPIMQHFLGLYPLPNQPGRANNYVFNPKLNDNNDQGDVKIDQNFSPKDTMFVRYSMGDRQYVAPLALPGVPLGGYFADNAFLPQTINNRGAAVSYTHSFSPSLVNDFRLGFNRQYTFISPRSGGVNIAKQFGISGVPDSIANGLTLAATSGFTTLGDNSDQRRGQAVYQVLDNLSKVHGRHLFKMGFDHRRTQLNFGQSSQGRGSYTFDGVFTQNPLSRNGTGNAFADFLLGTSDVTGIGTYVDVGLRIRNYSGFFQDDWKVNSRLTLNLGMRYEYTTPPTETHNRIAVFDTVVRDMVFAKPGGIRDRALANRDLNNFGPRLGIAWQVAPNWVIRTGYGIFYTLEDAGYHSASFNPPFQSRLVTNSDQVNVSSARLPAQGFPIFDPTADFHNQFLDIHGHPYNLPAAYAQQWNFTLQRQIRNFLLEGAYVGNDGNKLMGNHSINQPTPGAAAVNTRRPYQGWGAIDSPEPRGHSIYNGLQLKAEKRFSRGHTFLVSYAWAKAIDDADSTQLVTNGGVANLQDQRNYRAERSRSYNDVRHRLVASYLWELPFGTGHALAGGVGKGWNRIVSGWQLNGITAMQGGRPFTVISSFDQSNTGIGTNARPDATGISPVLPADQRTLQRFINTGAYSLPAGFAFGSAGRNSATGPGQVNFDLSLFKIIPLDGEGKRKLQFRAEFFNAMNTPQFDVPNRTFGTAAFGSITNTINDNRDVQLGLKLLW